MSPDQKSIEVRGRGNRKSAEDPRTSEKELDAILSRVGVKSTELGHTGRWITIASGEAAARLSARPVLISVSGSGSSLGRRPRVYFIREAGAPNPVVRSFLTDRDGRGQFLGYAPRGLLAIMLIPDEITVSPDDVDRLQVRLRPLGLVEAALRLCCVHPRMLFDIGRLLFCGNRKGVRVRFKEGIETLCCPKYRKWVDAQETALIRGRNMNIGGTGSPEVLVTIEGGVFRTSAEHDAALSATRASLERQTLRTFREVESFEVTALSDKRHFWIRLPLGIVLHPFALEMLAEALTAHSDAVAVYCDEDRIDGGRRRDPLFKPKWNRPLAEAGYLPLEGAMLRLTALPAGADFTTATGPLVLLAAGKHRDAVVHVPHVLMHRADRPSRTVFATKVPTRDPVPRVSVVIPTRDRADLLAACLDGLLNRTPGVELDIIVVDNDSREQATFDLFARSDIASRIRRLEMPGEFNFSRACNSGIAIAHHEKILLLNNDVEPLSSDWLCALCDELEDAAVGAAGALLLFPDGHVQHAGVALGDGSVARHVFHFLNTEDGRNKGFLELRRDVAAVTAACLLTRRSLWEAVGGMDDRSLAVTFNDVDYCLKLRAKGLRIVWTPEARLLHRESVSRRAFASAGKRAQQAAEEQSMAERWGTVVDADPFDNPNVMRRGGSELLVAQPIYAGVRAYHRDSFVSGEAS